MEGWAFPASALETLGIASTSITIKKTDVVGLYLLDVEETGSELDVGIGSELVTIQGANIEQADVIRRVLGHFASKHGIRIIASSPHGEVAVPTPARSFMQHLQALLQGRHPTLLVYFYSVPIGPALPRRLSHVFGITLEREQGAALLPSGIGVPIRDENEVIVAEVIRGREGYDALYILFDLPHGGNAKNVASLMSNILAEYEKIIGNEEYEGADKERSRASYVELRLNNIKEEIGRTEADLERLRKELVDLQNQVVERASQIQRLEQRVGALRGEVERQNVGDEFDRLSGIPEIRRVIVDREGIIVLTREIEVDFNGRIYNLGQFVIYIFPPTPTRERSEIRIFNRSNLIRGNVGVAQHPHINAEGECCWGSIVATIPELLGRREYFVLLQVIINFLKSINPSSWYRPITEWPEKSRRKEEEER
ncbi:MAG: hypothetical protein QW156_04190 [Candidatus Aenigmatarchaeota archaeon]